MQFKIPRNSCKCDDIEGSYLKFSAKFLKQKFTKCYCPSLCEGNVPLLGLTALFSFDLGVKLSEKNEGLLALPAIFVGLSNWRQWKCLQINKVKTKIAPPPPLCKFEHLRDMKKKIFIFTVLNCVLNFQKPNSAELMFCFGVLDGLLPAPNHSVDVWEMPCGLYSLHDLSAEAFESQYDRRCLVRCIISTAHYTSLEGSKHRFFCSPAWFIVHV